MRGLCRRSAKECEVRQPQNPARDKAHPAAKPGEDEAQSQEGTGYRRGERSLELQPWLLIYAVEGWQADHHGAIAALGSLRFEWIASRSDRNGALRSEWSATIASLRYISKKGKTVYSHV